VLGVFGGGGGFRDSKELLMELNKFL